MTESTEREDLALEMHRTPGHPGGYGWTAYLPMADQVLAAGFRRITVTDDMVQRALSAWWIHGESAEESMRAALEAALAAEGNE